MKPTQEYFTALEKACSEIEKLVERVNKLEKALTQIRDMVGNADESYYDCLKIAEEALK
jgi:phosphopantetheine adenylyltransferase